MKTIQDYDRELEALGKQHAEIWGRIQQLRAERNLALVQYARASVQSATAPAVQYSTWNDHGHRNSNFSSEEKLA